MRRRPAGFNRRRRLQLERPERQIDPVAAEIAHRPVAEIPPAIPLGPWHIDLVERPRRRRAKPQIPLETRRNGVRRRRPVLHEHDVGGGLGVRLGGVQAPGARDPDVTFGDPADRAGLDQFDDAAVVVSRMDLGAHLRGDAGLGCGFADDARFLHVVSEGLFAVDVLLQLQGRQRGKCVGVLGRY